MVNNGPVEGILGELNSNSNIESSVLVSRSGMHIAGTAPEGVHLETFVAMSAILLGSAETAISDIKGELDNILVELDRSRIVIISAGNKALLVVVTNTKDNFQDILILIKKASDDISASL
jgi:predicted regulator of Ras-like GTPase activity (Roadblock/LC7/MglB family)